MENINKANEGLGNIYTKLESLSSQSNHIPSHLNFPSERSWAHESPGNTKRSPKIALWDPL